jgi:hypothetical protein
MLVAPPYSVAAEMVSGPGGCMALVADAERPGEQYAIMGCFPGYKFQSGAVYYIRREEGQWASTRIIELPFAHRIDIITFCGARYLVAATLAADKSDPSDWSQPGSLSVSPLSRRLEESWTLTPVLDGIHRNHGLLKARFQGRMSVLVSGTEGLFAADLERRDATWSFARIMSQEISEIAVCDLEGDGHDELVTIEPFHGNSLCVYKEVSGGWKKAWEGELTFGHGLITHMLGGVPSVVVSNRAGSQDLILLQFPPGRQTDSPRLGKPSRTIVDSGVAAANALVLSHNGQELVFSTNQATGEIAVYSLAP